MSEPAPSTTHYHNIPDCSNNRDMKWISKSYVNSNCWTADWGVAYLQDGVACSDLTMKAGNVLTFLDVCRHSQGVFKYSIQNAFTENSKMHKGASPFVCTHTHMQVHTQTHICIHTWTCIHVCVCAHTHTNTHTHTHTQKHTYTHTQRKRKNPTDTYTHSFIHKTTTTTTHTHTHTHTHAICYTPLNSRIQSWTEAFSTSNRSFSISLEYCRRSTPCNNTKTKLTGQLVMLQPWNKANESLQSVKQWKWTD